MCRAQARNPPITSRTRAPGSSCRSSTAARWLSLPLLHTAYTSSAPPSLVSLVLVVGFFNLHRYGDEYIIFGLSVLELSNFREAFMFQGAF